MKTVSKLLAIVAAGACVVGCEPPMDRIVPDLDPPYVVRVTPSGNAVAAEASFEIKFSEPIQQRSIFWHDEDLGEALPDGVVLGLADDEDYLKSAIDNPPLSSTQRKKTLPVEVELSASRDTVTVRPLQPLEGLTNYTLLLTRKIKDDRSNSLIKAPGEKTNATQLFSFTTAAAPDRSPPVATLRNPVAETEGVPIELSQVEVGFSEELDATSLTSASIGLRVRGTETELVTASVSLNGLVATFTLGDHPDGDCEKLCPDTEYQLWVSSTVTDLSGNPLSSANLASQFFKSATCTDDEPPRLANNGDPEVEPGDVSVKVTWLTDEASTSVVELVEGDEAKLLTECGASVTEACVVTTGATQACPEADVCDLSDEATMWKCPHSVVVGGLSPSTHYTLRVLSADAKGQHVYGNAVGFDTLEPLPKIVLNEVFATPQGLSTTNHGKFIELVNAGLLDVDLAGWKLGRCTDAQCSAGVTNQWTLKAAQTGESTVLAVGAFAVAAGDAFDATVMDVPVGTLALRGSSGTLLANGLTSTTAYTYVLLTPDDQIVSYYGAWLGVPNKTDSKPETIDNNGRSFERVSASSPDESGNWTQSTTEIATAAGNFATPGRKNSAAP